MCGRFTLRTPMNELVEQFLFDMTPADLVPRYNVAPTQEISAVRLNREGTRREWASLVWGLVPMWAKDPSIGSRMINARAETVAEKPAFRKAFEKRRCLVLADGYLEWRKEGGKKQPYWIRMQSGRPFAFAGLWERWRGPGELRLESCTIVTTDANDLTRPVHDRMPAILPAAQYDRWLDAAHTAPEAARRLLRPFPSDEMQMEPVSTRVNNVRNDDPACLERIRTLF